MAKTLKKNTHDIIAEQLYTDNSIRNERRAWAGLDAMIEEGKYADKSIARTLYFSKLQDQHEKTVQLMKDFDDLVGTLETWDSRIHWIVWNEEEADEYLYAKCGALIHDGKHWHSTGTWKRALSDVTCEECTSLEEYNLKLLAETDIGDDEPKIQPPNARQVPYIPVTIPGEGIEQFLDSIYKTDE